jgi:DNA invertase Pin-like site-specific DNA recombinase
MREIVKAALYARFSTDKQSDSSIADQFRVCERLAATHDFVVVNRFSDAAISGGTVQRPGYQAMLEAARRRDFDVILAEDCSRLWRLLAEQAPRLAELADLGIHVVTYDLDTRQESAAILGAVNGAMAEAYRREIARRTRRGLEGRARQKKPTGGKTYGFVGDEVDPAQAAIVVEIFERYAAGEAQRSIATDLNRRGIPSPGATWNRRERSSDGKWRVSAIHAMMRNERYIGQVVWNRCRWIRSAADSSKRKRVENPRSEWIVREGPAIVDEVLWRRVQGRANTGFASTKARPKYLLSGLLECGVCGAKMTITGGRGQRYICGNRHTGVGCENDLGVARDLAEELILEPVTAKLLAPDAVEHAVKTIRGLSRGSAQPRGNKQIAELRRLIDEGILSEGEAAPAIRRLGRTESAVQPNPPTAAADAYRTVVTALRESLEADDVAAARPILRDLIGPISAVPTEEDGQRFLTAHFPAGQRPMALAVGAVVAGARCQRYLALFTALDIAAGPRIFMCSTPSATRP